MATLRKITAIITAIIGIAVIILGTTLMGEPANHSVDDYTFRYAAEEFSVNNASFGADFYTYMYKSNYVIVDELNDINKAFETVVRAQNSINAAATANVEATDDLIDTVNNVGGMVVIAIGLAILAYAVQCIGMAFAPTEKAADMKPEIEVVEEAEIEEENM